MVFRDALNKGPVEKITVRMNSDNGRPYKDELFGLCGWDGEKLISLDGDSYGLDEEIYRFEYDEDGGLTVWLFIQYDDTM